MTRYPFHRYLRYLILEGDDAVEVQRHIADLGYIPPTTEDIEFLRATLVTGHIVDAAWRTRCEVDMFDDDSPEMSQAHWIVETGIVRACVERALFDKVSARHCALIVSLKFGHACSEQAIALFRRGWWDTETLTAIDFAHYFELQGRRKPDPPDGVPLHIRPAAAAWAQGVLPAEEDLSTDDIIRTLQVDSFMQYEQARVVPSPGSQDEARKWAIIALRTSQIRKPKSAKREQQELPGLKPKVYYPGTPAPSLADLEQADDDGDTDNDDPI